MKNLLIVNLLTVINMYTHTHTHIYIYMYITLKFLEQHLTQYE
jgi:ABC-type uncharacterized transport system substrate-binding protein